MLKDFKQFVLRGDVVDLAVGVVIGAAFSEIVAALVKDLLTPLIAAVYGEPDFSSAYFTLNDSRFLYGDFINALVSFLLIAATVFFLVVRPINQLREWSDRRQQPPIPRSKKCPYCLTAIAAKASRCPNCTSRLDSKGSA